MDVRSVAEIVALLIKRRRLGKSTLCVIIYMDISSGSLHDSVLAKFCNTCFDGLTEENLLSSIAGVSQAQKEEFARRVNILKDYYCSGSYELA